MPVQSVNNIPYGKISKLNGAAGNIDTIVDIDTIVTDGLAFYVSAADSLSYPGSGTTWTDISANNNSGSLTNGAVYDSGDGGSIDSSNAISLAGSTGQTWEAWFNADGTGDSYQRIFDKSNGGNGLNGHFLTVGANPNDGRVYCRLTPNSDDSGDGYFDNMYTVGNWTTTTTNAKIGTWNHSTSREFRGNIAAVRLYNKDLSLAEELQNYNAEKSRYGL